MYLARKKEGEDDESKWLKVNDNVKNSMPGEKEIRVLVELPTQRQPASIKRQRRHRGLGSNASCIEFLDAVVRQHAVLYDFDFYFLDEVLTMGNVLHAVKRRARMFRMKKGKLLTDIALSGYFSMEELKALKNPDQFTTRRIYDGKVPTTSNGEPYIILPHDMFSDEKVNKLKNITAKANVVSRLGRQR
ncbi:hypothetical protein PRIC2_013950 [Phytophthora ramorum]